MEVISAMGLGLLISLMVQVSNTLVYVAVPPNILVETLLGIIMFWLLQVQLLTKTLAPLTQQPI